MSPTTAMVAIFAIFGLGMILSEAGDVDKARANAQAECYKAAQVNKNITCENGEGK